MSTKKVVLNAFAASALVALAVWSGCGDNMVGGLLDSYTLTVSANPPGGGSVSRDPAQGVYRAGASVSVTAAANPGYAFVKWSGASASADDYVTVVMDRNQTLTANFKYINCAQKNYTVSFNTAGGIPSVLNPVTVECGGALGADFPENPTREGFEFGAWFDGATGAAYTAQTLITKNVTLTAEWIAVGSETKIFTVFFNVNGGSPSAISPIDVDSGGMMGTNFPEAPTRSGYRFEGWFDGSSQQYAANTVISSDVALTAAWTLFQSVKQFTVSFNTNGGSPSMISSVRVDSGSALGTGFSLPPDPSKIGYVFDGWFDDATQYTISTVVVKDVTLMAAWAPIDNPIDSSTVAIEDSSKAGKYATVTFDTDGGNPSIIGAIKVGVGNALGTGTGFPLSNPTKPTYDFGGWFDGDKQYTASTVITEDITLKAKWTPSEVAPIETVKHFIVSFDTDGGSPEMLASITVDSGKALGTGIVLSASNPTKPGNTFGGWFDGAALYTINTIITKDVTLSAKWIRHVTVTFSANGGSPSAIGSVTFDSGTALGAKFPESPTKIGYVFDGWFDASTQYTASTAIDRDVTLAAKWTIKSYTVQFYPNGGSPSAIIFATAESGSKFSSIAPASPTRAGYDFAGWFDGSTQYTASMVIYEDVTLVASWAAIRYAITFDVNGGTLGSTAYFAADSGSVFELGQFPSSVRRTGYTFDGWFDGSTQYADDFVVTKSITLTAKWTIKKYSVTFDVDGGSPEFSPASVDSGTWFANVPATNPTKAGYTFGGWYSAGVKFNQYVQVTKDVTFTARWIPRYEISFDPNGGTLTVTAPVIYDSGSTFGIANYINQTKTGGYTFVGWYDERGVEYTRLTVICQDAKLTAKWTIRQFKVTLDLNVTKYSSSLTNEVIIVDSGTAIGDKLPTNPTTQTRSHNVFLGWWSGGEKWTGRYTSSTIIDKDVTLLAMWGVKTNKATWMADNLNTPSTWCYNCGVYGGLYSWQSAKTACPTGWHLPTAAEWSDLVKYAGGDSTAASKLKTTNDWAIGEGGTNDYGFGALPGSVKSITSGGEYFLGSKNYAVWWTATESEATKAYGRTMRGANNQVLQEPFAKTTYGFSVRCVQD